MNEEGQVTGHMPASVVITGIGMVTPLGADPREVLRQVTPDSTLTSPWHLKALQADGTALPGQFTIEWGREARRRYTLCTIRYGILSVELEWEGVWYRKTRF